MKEKEKFDWDRLWQYLSFKEENPFFGICLCIILVVLLLGMALCGPSVTRSVEKKEAILKKESSLVYTGLLIGAVDYPTVAGGFSNSHNWFLTLEGGAKIMIRKSRFWLAPVGKKIFIYKYNDSRKESRKHYVELEEREK